MDHALLDGVTLQANVSSAPPPRARSSLRALDVSWGTFIRAVVILTVAWAWWRLWQWVLVFLIGVFMAVALEPMARRLEAYGIRRWIGGPLIVLGLVGMLGGFFVAAGASLAVEARLVAGRVGEFIDMVRASLPVEFREAATSLLPDAMWLGVVARGSVAVLGAFVTGLLVTVYLLVDGRRTYKWLAAFAPPASRPRVHATAACARGVIVGYVRGNVITSVLATLATWVALRVLGVPAALMLALTAGLLNFVPVIGLYVSAGPAVLLALMVSPAVATSTAAFYVLYNIVENAYLQPAVYGRELRLSGLTVIAAFLVGAELGGVLGALVALPVAAVYPDVERIWFDRPGTGDTADEHRRVEAQEEH